MSENLPTHSSKTTPINPNSDFDTPINGTQCAVRRDAARPLSQPNEPPLSTTNNQQHELLLTNPRDRNAYSVARKLDGLE